MKKQILSTKFFEVSFNGATRPLNFEAGFRDAEINAWKYEDDKLVLIFKDGERYFLSYDKPRARFVGPFKSGEIVVAPSVNNVDKFRQAVKQVNELPSVEKPKPVRVEDYAIISKPAINHTDRYPFDTRENAQIDDLFGQGYNWIVFVESGTLEEVHQLLDLSDPTRVNHLYSGTKKNNLIALHSSLYHSLGQFKEIYNFKKNLSVLLETRREEPNYVMEKQNG